MGVCNCSIFCCTLLYVHSSIAIVLMGKRELVALLNLSSWCLVMVERLFLAVPRGCLRFVIVVFPDHTHLLFTVQISLVYILTTNLFLNIYLVSKQLYHCDKQELYKDTSNHSQHILIMIYYIQGNEIQEILIKYNVNL